jgi:hypothetical protein
METSPETPNSTLTEADWKLLLRRIKGKRCTPFIGAGASVPSLPLGSQVANEWANKYDYPLSDSWDLPKVAQYLAVCEDEYYPKEQIQLEFSEKSPPDFEKEDQPHRMLADLDLPVYLTTNYDDFMYAALRHRKRKPKRELCHWNEAVKDLAPSVLSGDYKPTVEEPLIFHLHGHIDFPQSMVLTEDDYLEFLVKFSKESRLRFLPAVVRRSFAYNSLLFVGYSLADWNFRVLLRSVLESLGGTPGMKSIAVQFEPPAKDTSKAGLKRAMNYLDRYFSRIHHKIRVRVYWGDARQFAHELQLRWQVFNRES